MQVNSVKHSKTWLSFSSVLIGLSIFFMVMSTLKLGTPFRLGLDFTGGTKLEYKFAKPITALDSEEVSKLLNENGLENSNVTTTNEGIPTLIIRTKAISDSPILEKLNAELKTKYGEFEIGSIDTVSPVVGPELFQKGLLALFLTVVGIVFYISSRFQRDYAFAAIAALIHDMTIVMGLFAYLGLYHNIEVNTLFITALLTTFGFSVHDTIVVFDRIRENQKLQTSKFSFAQVADFSINQVCMRSLNTSFTVLLTLALLFFFGGASTQSFTGALFVGMMVGAYSSIFLASPVLVWLQTRK